MAIATVKKAFVGVAGAAALPGFRTTMQTRLPPASAPVFRVRLLCTLLRFLPASTSGNLSDVQLYVSGYCLF
jgi:hypothetical protein